MGNYSVQFVCNNKTDKLLSTKTPTPAAVSIGNITTYPQSVQPGDQKGQAGLFSGTKGLATGITALSVYNFGSPDQVLFFFVMLPHTLNATTITKCGFMPSGLPINGDLADAIYNDQNFGPANQHTFNRDGKDVTLHCESVVGQQDHTEAVFTVQYI